MNDTTDRVVMGLLAVVLFILVFLVGYNVGLKSTVAFNQPYSLTVTEITPEILKQCRTDVNCMDIEEVSTGCGGDLDCMNKRGGVF